MVVPLRNGQNEIDIRGLLFLFTIFQVHRSSCISFDVDKLHGKPKTGWAMALHSGTQGLCRQIRYTTEWHGAGYFMIPVMLMTRTQILIQKEKEV